MVKLTRFYPGIRKLVLEIGYNSDPLRLFSCHWPPKLEFLVGRLIFVKTTILAPISSPTTRSKPAMAIIQWRLEDVVNRMGWDTEQIRVREQRSKTCGNSKQLLWLERPILQSHRVRRGYIHFPQLLENLPVSFRHGTLRRIGSTSPTEGTRNHGAIHLSNRPFASWLCTVQHKAIMIKGSRKKICRYDRSQVLSTRLIDLAEHKLPNQSAPTKWDAMIKKNERRLLSCTHSL